MVFSFRPPPHPRSLSCSLSSFFFFLGRFIFIVTCLVTLCNAPVQHSARPFNSIFWGPLFWAFHVFQQRLPSFTSLRFQRNYLIRNTAKRVADWAATCAGCRVKQERRRSSIFEILLIHATAFQDPCFFNRVTVFFHTVTASNVGIVSDAYFMPLLSAI